MLDIKVRLAGDEKKIQSNRLSQEAFERQQTQWNKSMDGHMRRMIMAVENLVKKPPDATTLVMVATPPRGQKLPSSTTIKLTKTPGPKEWFEWWETNNNDRGWDEFLLDIKRRFDPDLYEDYVGRLATLRQKGSPESYLAEFEPMLRKKPVDAVCGTNFQPRQPRESQAHSDYPIVRVSAAEWADRTKKGLCWYCPEPYSRSHVCSKKFYALMGDDKENTLVHDEEELSDGEEVENMVISGDVYRVLVIGPKLRPRSIRITSMIYEAPVSVLIDGGMLGNGASLRCDYVSLSTPIYLQGNRFDIELFLLQVEGPDVILGVQWL
ncbi:hypothetical protein SASPL_132934 [Salvia splendens]|uniref:Retrotransposon gag domain-containing protein n=1 Tax=Salvia splendens TaxID=180675 RepID=A0A8X8X0C9_SALSN|nr:hypothetical protein SASPL_132934 [Salvia splendens]